ncbi:hypothetical protein Mkiyose1384_36790 [Mycobacterium kiyosense]|nr:hypothetical protein SRL2020130_30570 [Mycobacterium kiyosense]GLC00566.1 hypothetical protein SRL2020400_11570 [Mycobacterium kiyosense]GLC08800.1 hypothetical protein SRL2020411_34460 [Mycobacterium kiyosense]GLC14690.1 hypothetical protein SRL2020448_32930 [Mycobacterium kiyosense]GLD07311.1 hypothetical protein Mkiyose1383_36370 [Mycobacterium kiyosense]
MQGVTRRAVAAVAGHPAVTAGATVTSVAGGSCRTERTAPSAGSARAASAAKAAVTA